MKYPNPKFPGMSMITPAEIDKSIKKYYIGLKSWQVRKLGSISTISDLIEFCIEDYRAWGDAVLMGAGAYLKIGSFPKEIDAAKRDVKTEVEKYLTSECPASQSTYDEWHKNICENLSNPTKHFSSYSVDRKTSTDKFKNKYGFTIGNAQKFLNMLMKDLYACLHFNPLIMPTYEDYFKYCHMPLDTFILRFVDDVRFRTKTAKIKRTYTWGNMNTYADYMHEQEVIRSFVSAGKITTTPTVLQTEFVVWPLYK